MFIKAIQSYHIGVWEKAVQRTTTYGKYKGYHIAIDNLRKGQHGNILEKRYVIWNDNMQKIVNKYRKETGGFERIG